MSFLFGSEVAVAADVVDEAVAVGAALRLRPGFLGTVAFPPVFFVGFDAVVESAIDPVVAAVCVRGGAFRLGLGLALVVVVSVSSFPVATTAASLADDSACLAAFAAARFRAASSFTAHSFRCRSRKVRKASVDAYGRPVTGSL